MKIFRTGAASCTFLFLALIIVLPGCQMKNQPIVYIPSEHVSLIDLAAKEIRRYVYLRTGTILEIRDIDKIDTTRGSIVLGVDTTLPSESFQLFNDIVETNNYASLQITGHNPVSVLYGAYAFIEKLGVRFYLHGDVIPDKKIRFEIPDLNETHTPRFAIRGIQPFHDFPEGPDWWTLEDYKAYLNQMVKMRMNFIGFHTYPQGGVGPEPLVWIGPKNAVNDNGTVKTAYRARHFLTSSGTWGYSPKNTSDYSHGLGVLFPDDNYGTDYMKGITVWPENPDQEVMLFNRSAAFFREVFEYAHQLGIKTCVGTETPLVVPSQVKERYPGLTAEDYYEGIFTWIKKNYPVDYYWFWTPEGWTWGGNSDKDIQATIDDLSAAQKAVKATGASFQLATCGWVLGPAQDRAMFDRILPKTWPMSCINRQVGFSPVDSAFARIKGRPLWAIPWMEDDPALTIPQLWAGRMIEDASDALNSGCAGLLGIHWRTRPLSMNVGALAQAGWGESDGESTDVDGYYHNWALGNFGVEVADSMAGLFAGMDGQEIRINRGGGRKTRLPRPADWAHGPGGVVPDTTDWEIRKRDYAFVDRMESWRDLIHKPGYRERFDYWLNQFKYLRAYGKFACTVGQINQYLARYRRGDQSVRTNAADELVKLR
ncbi:MAG: hypothetical protein J7L89_04540, partial [Bacteroidales bacterium]|nr:hypothetical protein [Bacteroidales bacterium]